MSKGVNKFAGGWDHYALLAAFLVATYMAKHYPAPSYAAVLALVGVSFAMSLRNPTHNHALLTLIVLLFGISCYMPAYFAAQRAQQQAKEDQKVQAQGDAVAFLLAQNLQNQRVMTAIPDELARKIAEAIKDHAESAKPKNARRRLL